MNTIEKLNQDLLIKQFNEFKAETFNDLENVVNYLKIKIDAIKYPFLEKEIDEIGLSVRTFNNIISHLQKYDMYDRQRERPKVKHIVQVSLEDFMKNRQVGEKTISELESILNEHGYSFKP
jgi:DNA-directed RNA polymerase alpha subunit